MVSCATVFFFGAGCHGMSWDGLRWDMMEWDRMGNGIGWNCNGMEWEPRHSNEDTFFTERACERAAQRSEGVELKQMQIQKSLAGFLSSLFSLCLSPSLF